MPLFLALSVASVVTSAPVKLIIDTDIGGGGCRDVDDVAAIGVGHALADRGEAELLAIVHNTSPLQCAGAISVFNHFYGRDSVPIGAYKGADLRMSDPLPYVPDVVEHYPSPIKNSTQVPDAVDVYRAVLAAQPDNSVTISSIGLLTNLRALLQSAPDAHSSMTGYDLVAAKVRLLAVMGGKYPSSGVAHECNLSGGDGFDHKTASAASGYVFANMPPSTRILFLGFDVGVKVKTGGRLTQCAPVSNPLRQAFVDNQGPGNDRCSWDPLTTLIAVRGAAAGACAECSDCDGTNAVDPSTGDNKWVPGPRSNQTYVVLQNATAAGIAIDDLLCTPPKFGQGR